MRAHDYDHDGSGSLPLKPARLDGPDTRLAAAAAAAGRWDVAGAGGLLGLQRSAGNQAVAAALQGEELSPVHDVINSGGGQPLESGVRADMEARLGHDFGDVRVHHDARAEESAKAVNAHAYTVGSDVVFQRDRYDPSSDQGRVTLAHELTHVVQQRNGPVDAIAAPGGIRLSDPSDRFEQEAAASAERAIDARDLAPATPLTGLQNAAAVQRKGDEQEGQAPAAVQGTFVHGEAAQEDALSIQRAERGASFVQRQEATTGGAPPAAPPERSGFIEACANATSFIQSQVLFANAFAEAAGDAYHTAYQHHSDAVQAAGADQATVDKAFLDAALAFIPGGGIKGAIGNLMTKACAGAGGFIFDGSKDVIATNATKFVTKGAQIAFPSEKLAPIAMDPVSYRAQLVVRIDREYAAISETVTQWMKNARDTNSQADFDFDPMQLVENAVKMSGQNADALKTEFDPANYRCAGYMEKGIWKAWVESKTWTGDGGPEGTQDRPQGTGPGAEVHSGGFLIAHKCRARILACATSVEENGEDWIKDWSADMYALFHGVNYYEGETEKWQPDDWSVSDLLSRLF